MTENVTHLQYIALHCAVIVSYSEDGTVLCCVNVMMIAGTLDTLGHAGNASWNTPGNGKWHFHEGSLGGWRRAF